MFYNSSIKEIVFAFKGSSNIQDFYSDFADAGAAIFEEMKGMMEKAWGDISINPVFTGYTKFAVGHSLGGGLAQSFAAYYGIDGYGENSLPISSAAIKDWNLTSNISNYAQSGHTFIETNIEGDPATYLYNSETFGYEKTKN